MAENKFRELVQDLVKESNLFGISIDPSNPEDRMTVLDAIEKNQILIYTDRYSDNRKINALLCLIAIYHEIATEEPDQCRLNTMTEKLKEYL